MVLSETIKKRDTNGSSKIQRIVWVQGLGWMKERKGYDTGRVCKFAHRFH